MRRKEIEQIGWLAPVSKNKCMISAMVLPAKGMKQETLVVDVSNTKPAVRFCLSQNEYATYFPEGSTLAVKNEAHWCYKMASVYSYSGVNFAKKKGSYTNLPVKISDEMRKVIRTFVLKYWPRLEYVADEMCMFSDAESILQSKKYFESEERKNRVIQEEMDKIPPEPAGFRDWLAKEFEPIHYMTIIPFRKNKHTKGTCSHCGNEVTILKGDVKDKKTICPECGTECNVRRSDYKANGNRYDVVVGWDNHAILFQRHPYGGFVERLYAIDSVTKFDEELKISVFEKKRRIIRNGHEICYWRYNYCESWNKSQYGDGWYHTSPVNTKIYPGTFIPDLVAGTKYQYSAVDRMIGVRGFSPLNYLHRYESMPELEFLAKMGMTNLANHIGGFADDHGTPWNRLGITKEDFELLKSTNGDVDEYHWMRIFFKRGESSNQAVIKFLIKYSFKEDTFSFIDDRMSYEQIVNFMKRQMEDEHYDRSYTEMVSTWSDYLAMAAYMKRNVKSEYVYRPKNLRAAHDEMVKISGGAALAKRELEILSKFPNVNEICTEIKVKYEYRNETYCIVCPDGIKDIIEEGIALEHCLHRSDIYFSRIERRESFIVFLRKADAPDIPYYTLEIEPGGATRQKRTTGDRQNADFKEAVSFIREWQKAIKKRLSKKDIELQSKSAVLREEEFKELRKNGNKIWHGVLAGKLLVDVLEADFMDVEPDVDLSESAAG